MPRTLPLGCTENKTWGVRESTGSVTHFEIYAEEPAKLADFYRGVFEWRLDKAPGVDYWRIQTGSAALPASMVG